MARGRALLGVVVQLALACSGSSADEQPAGGGAGGQGVASGSGGASGGGGQQFGNAPPSDGPPMALPEPTPEPSTPGEVVEACRSLESRTMGVPVKQADVIIVLDNSGSMNDEIDQVRDNLNGFAAALGASDVEPRVVMISAALDTTAWLGVCIPAPLGSGLCPDDDNPPSYKHITQHVLDTNPPITTDIFVQDNALLDQFSMYSFSQWRTLLRPGVSKNVVVISDHDTVLSPDYFMQWMGRQHEFVNDPWRFHAVVCLDDTCAEPGVWSGRRVGTVYRQLVDATGGVAVQITSSSFDQIFETLANDIVQTASALPCGWGIPDAPDDRALDPNQVNLRFTGPDGREQTILGVRKADDCAITGGGWYYDDPIAPTRIEVCEETCTVLGLQPSASVQIEFGCERERDLRVD